MDFFASSVQTTLRAALVTRAPLFLPWKNSSFTNFFKRRRLADKLFLILFHHQTTTGCRRRGEMNLKTILFVPQKYEKNLTPQEIHPRFIEIMCEPQQKTFVLSNFWTFQLSQNVMCYLTHLTRGYSKNERGFYMNYLYIYTKYIYINNFVQKVNADNQRLI